MQTLISQNWTYRFLLLGFAAPICYFGIQLLAAPWYENYSFLTNAASDLGSEQSVYPIVFNSGAIITGFITALSAYGFWHGLTNIRTPRAIIYIVCLGIILAGLSSIWAGIYPLPDSRHGANPFAIGLFTLPFFMFLAFWQQTKARVYLLAPILLFLSLVPIMSGLIPINQQPIAGLLQRLLALAAFSPLAIGAYLLLRNKAKQ